MTEAAAPSLRAQKRRQAVQVTGFLVAVALGTTVLFHVVHADLIAYRRGEQALARQDFAAAALDLGNAWRRGYQTPRARLDLARARLESGDRAGALPLYEQALAANPRDAGLIDTVAGLYQAADQPEKARRLYQRLGAADQLDERALVRLAQIDEQSGDFAGAHAAYERAEQKAPQDAVLALRHGIVLMNAGRRAEAAAEFRRALALDPQFAQARLRLARTLLWDGHFAEAITEYRAVLPP